MIDQALFWFGITAKLDEGRRGGVYRVIQTPQRWELIVPTVFL